MVKRKVALYLRVLAVVILRQQGEYQAVCWRLLNCVVIVGMATAMIVPSRATSSVVRQSERKIKVSRSPVGYCLSSSSPQTDAAFPFDCFSVKVPGAPKLSSLTPGCSDMEHLCGSCISAIVLEIRTTRQVKEWVWKET